MLPAKSISAALAMLIDQGAPDGRLLQIITSAIEEAVATRDPSNPLQLRSDVRRITDLLLELYGEDALPMAERVAERHELSAFSRVVISAVARRRRLEERVRDKQV